MFGAMMNSLAHFRFLFGASYLCMENAPPPHREGEGVKKENPQPKNERLALNYECRAVVNAGFGTT